MSWEALSWVWPREITPAARKFVAVAIADMADDEGVSFPKYATLAAKCSLSVDSVRGHVRQLEVDGVLKRERRSRPNGSQASNFFVVAPWTSPDPPSGPVQTPPLDQSTPIEPSVEPSVEPGGQGALLPDPLHQVWEHYQRTVGGAERRKLDPQRQTCIRRALGVRTVDECNAAIDVLAVDPFYNGQNHRQTKYLDIKYALGKPSDSPDEYIDKMIERGQRAAKSNSANGGTIVDRLCARFPSIDRPTIAFWLEGIDNGLRFPSRTQATKNGRLRKFHELGVDLIIDEEQRAVTGWTEVNE